jgi:hypothetical protein
MEPFPPPHMVWAPGETRWHCYALPDYVRDASLAELIRRSRAAALEVAGDDLASVEDEWVHATVSMISVPAAELESGAVEALARGLGRVLAEVPAFRLPARRPWAADSSVLMGLAEEEVPGQPWNVLSGLVEQAIGEQFGSRAMQYVPPPPHVTLAYCAKPTESAAIEAALRKVNQTAQTQRAHMSVGEICLVDVRQDAVAHTYTWNKETVIRIPLGT